MIDWFPIRLSFAVATAATLIALVAGSGLAWLLARKRFPGRNLIDALVVAARSASDRSRLLPAGGAGHALDAGGFLYRNFGIRLTFTVTAAIIAASIHALPLVTKSLRAAFEGVDTDLEAAARTLGLNNRRIFLRVTLPLASRKVCWRRRRWHSRARWVISGDDNDRGKHSRQDADRVSRDLRCRAGGKR